MSWADVGAAAGWTRRENSRPPSLAFVDASGLPGQMETQGPAPPSLLTAAQRRHRMTLKQPSGQRLTHQRCWLYLLVNSLGF